MVTVCMSKTPRDGIDFFPLQVDYEEKMYAVGKIPGGFKRREGRASDKAILTARLIDRPLRPLFPKGLFNDVVVVATALSVEPDVAPEPLAMIGSSVALSISDIPWGGPTGSVVVGLVDGEYVINPDAAQREKSTIHLNLAGTKDAILMIEAGADEVSNDEMVGAIMFGQQGDLQDLQVYRRSRRPRGRQGQSSRSSCITFPRSWTPPCAHMLRTSSTGRSIPLTDRSARRARTRSEKEILEHFADIYPDNTRELKDSVYYSHQGEGARQDLR